MAMSLVSGLPFQRAYAVSDDVTYKDMNFAIRSGTTDQLTLTSYSGFETVINIPETIDGNTVTAIGDKVLRKTALLTLSLCLILSIISELTFSAIHRYSPSIFRHH